MSSSTSSNVNTLTKTGDAITREHAKTRKTHSTKLENCQTRSPKPKLLRKSREPNNLVCETRLQNLVDENFRGTYQPINPVERMRSEISF